MDDLRRERKWEVGERKADKAAGGSVGAFALAVLDMVAGRSG